MEYGLYVAKVVNAALKDNRLQVQVLPQMIGLAPNTCPKWSPFFRDEMLLAKVGDLVWVVCDNEFSNGFVLGTANYATYEGESFEEWSIPEELKKALNETLVNLKASSFSFGNLKIQFWNTECIHMIERSSGGLIIAYKSGPLYVLRPDEFRVQIGASSLKIDDKTVSLAAPVLKLQGGNVELGSNPSGNVLITPGTDASAATPSEFVRA